MLFSRLRSGRTYYRPAFSEQVDMERLGGPEPHGRRSGVVHITAKDDESAMTDARRLTLLLGRQGRLTPAETVRSSPTPASR